MRFLIATLALPLLALSSPLAARTVSAADSTSSLLAQISTIESDITTLNNTLNSFTPDAILTSYLALEIQSQTSQLGDDINTATGIVNASAPFNSTQSLDIGLAVIALEPYISSLLNNIVAHKPAFGTVLIILDLSQTVEADLVQQKQESAELGAALADKLASPFDTLAPGITSTIEGYFDTAIADYEACSGLVCLPSLDGLKRVKRALRN